MKRNPWSVVLVASLLTVALVSPALAAEKPRIAVIEFENKAAGDWYSWWSRYGGGAAQEVFITELVKSGKFRVIERSRLDALMQEKNLALSGDVSADSAVQVGRLIGVKYILTGAFTEAGTKKSGLRTPRVKGLPSVGLGKKKFKAALNARLIDAETGEIVWADEATGSASSGKIRVGGFGGGTDDGAMFDRVLKPVVVQLVDSLKAADL